MATGTITVSVSGGNGNYNYKVTGPINTPFTSSAVISGLSAGQFTRRHELVQLPLLRKTGVEMPGQWYGIIHGSQLLGTDHRSVGACYDTTMVRCFSVMRNRLTGVFPGACLMVHIA